MIVCCDPNYIADSNSRVFCKTSFRHFKSHHLETVRIKPALKVGESMVLWYFTCSYIPIGCIEWRISLFGVDKMIGFAGDFDWSSEDFGVV